MDLWPSRGCVREGMYPNMVEQATANERKTQEFSFMIGCKKMTEFVLNDCDWWVVGWLALPGIITHSHQLLTSLFGASSSFQWRLITIHCQI